MQTGPSKINVVLIGGGAREHAIAAKLVESPRLGTLYVSHPQNPGLAALGKPVDVPVSTRESYRMEQFSEKHSIGLIVIGPEEPLAEGFADKLRTPTRMVFGPGADGARLEADKAWAKDLMRAAAIPTAEARVFTDAEAARGYMLTRASEEDSIKNLLLAAGKYRDPEERRRVLDEQRRNNPAVVAALARPHPGLPVIKAAGLAKGKGVIVPATLNEAIDALDRIMVQRVFGDAGNQVVIEDRLEGTEVSVLALVDGRSIYVLETCQDHKRLRDHDAGPNTGGMGAFCPSGSIDDAMMDVVQREILVPTLDALRREGIEYRGVLYAGLMLTAAGPKVLEFNCRFGDPECQALMVRLDSDLLELIIATCRGELSEVDVRWKPGASCCVVLAAPGYPDEPRAGLPITGVEDAAKMPGVSVFHAGTKIDKLGRLVTAGGRVLSVTAVGDNLSAARERAYAACDKIKFAGMQMRRDIGVNAAR